MGGQTLSVPLSFLHTQNGLALLQQLGVVRVDGDHNAIFLPQVTNEASQSTSIINTSSSLPSSTIAVQFQEVSQQSQSGSTNVDPAVAVTSSISHPSAALAGPTSASPNKGRNRVLGSGPLAISAQGIVQQVGGRRVTVLPRPEDLQRLKDQKALVMDVPDKRALSLQRRRGPVPVRPHQRYLLYSYYKINVSIYNFCYSTMVRFYYDNNNVSM